MWTRGLKVSCRYSSAKKNRNVILQMPKNSFLKSAHSHTSPRLNLMLLQLIDLHLDRNTHTHPMVPVPDPALAFDDGRSDRISGFSGEIWNKLRRWKHSPNGLRS
uniref:Uncharacterized protein n=1 Tax=Cyprinodon variegatus TaxID=28743 RepID=A0A3Q2FHC1_CYPVA